MRAEQARLAVDGSLLADPRALADLRVHALGEYPRECIGYIDRRGAYVQLQNVADDPLRFAIADRTILAEAIKSGDLRALCHSHPNGPDCPSESDMRAQLEAEVPFVIVTTNGQACAHPFAWGDQLRDDAPLIGRYFRHGVHDCYGLIRAHRLREFGELLPDYPRNWEWWHADCPGEKDLYRRHFADAGYRVVEPREVRIGDVFLAAVPFRDRKGGRCGGIVNHAGVMVENGVALHHPTSGLAYDPQRLSKREPVHRWQPWIKEGGNFWLRRD